MTQKQKIRNLFHEYGYVTNAMLDEAGILHIGRNRISELKSEYMAQGIKIIFTAGDTFLANRWNLVRMEELNFQFVEGQGQLFGEARQ